MQKTHDLDNALKEYSGTGIYPFHMPGHKRQDVENRLAAVDRNRRSLPGETLAKRRYPEQLDITEIEGFDNLHHPEGIIARAQQEMAQVFGADHSFFLVNGSTAGLLAAISAAVPAGGRILIARNCHKAVYHAIELRGLSVEYVYPKDTLWGIQGSIDPGAVAEKLAVVPDIQAVLITSPTYDGVVSDIAAIAEIVHGYDIPLIVDEAHGAHFGFSKGFPEKALHLGADLVIESMHKTLPAYTQSGALHVKGQRVSVKSLQRWLGIYQTSSPSYLFMGGLARCTRIMREQGASLLQDLEKKLARFYQEVSGLQHLWVMTPKLLSVGNLVEAAISTPLAAESGESGIHERDASKILIFTHGTGMSGEELSTVLLEQYQLQMEMASGHYVTALTSLMDTEDGFARLSAALKEIDEAQTVDNTPKQHSEMWTEAPDWRRVIDELYLPKEKVLEIGQAVASAQEPPLPWQKAAGKVSLEYAYLYPPGIPFLVPGEVVTEHLAQAADALLAAGFAIQGMEDLTGREIVVKG